MSSKRRPPARSTPSPPSPPSSPSQNEMEMTDDSDHELENEQEDDLDNDEIGFDENENDTSSASSSDDSSSSASDSLTFKVFHLGEQKSNENKKSSPTPSSSSTSSSSSPHYSILSTDVISSSSLPLDFSSFDVCSPLLTSCRSFQIFHPTPIQSICIPLIRSGNNVIGKSKTGSGKTAAFLLPLLHEWNKDPFGVFAILLTPTRELAAQLSEQVSAYGKNMRVHSVMVVGGGDITSQSIELSRSPHIIIATPGRLADVLKSHHQMINLKFLKFLVLDECDRLLEQSFQKDLDTILTFIPPPEKRQTLLFSATITPQSPELYSLRLPSPKFVEISSLNAIETVSQLDQKYLFIPQISKECYLIWILTASKLANHSTIIFTSTCKGCEILSEILSEMSISNVSLHSRKSQKDRFASLNSFRSSPSSILVCTDVASRGLDIPSVLTVINYDVPRMTSDYIHRVGRTARAGRGGVALTFVSQYDIDTFKAVEREVGTTMSEYHCKEEEVMENVKVVARAKMAAKRIVDEREENNPKIGKIKREKQEKYEERQREQRKGERREEKSEKSRQENPKKNEKRKDGATSSSSSSSPSPSSNSKRVKSSAVSSNLSSTSSSQK